MPEATLSPRLRPFLSPIRGRSPLPPAAWAFWLAVVAPAAIALELATLRLDATGGWMRFAILTVAASVAQLSSVQLTRRRVFQPAMVFVVAGALLLAPHQLALLCVLHNIPDWIKQRYAWYIELFNIANYVLAGLAAYGAAHAIASAGAAADVREAAAGAAAAVICVCVNRGLLLPMLRLGRGLGVRASRLLALDDLALDVVLALMAVPLAALWRHSVWVAPLALTPLVLIHVTQRASHRLELASETIAHQNEQLEAANHLVIERSTVALEALSATVDARDAYTAGHSRRVRDFAVLLGEELGLTQEELESLGQAALLHDIGKIGVPDSVLLKEGALTQAEWLVMKSHPEEGARIIERLGYLDQVVPAIRHHHERADGRGYPSGRREDETPLAARIIHVADALDAMLTKRVYRDALTLEQAIDEIRRGRSTDFCASCVDAFERVLAAGRFFELIPSTARVAA
ncbi:MAG TPA: HD-GYP domain-containing protein [Gaiellaceae bacterium]|nr:HD-GYP domain-containing protein [Gaiellaceae bacterium]